MIRSLTVTNYLNESIFIDLFRPEETGLLVREITGLGPAKGTINITEISTNDGGVYNSSRLSSRNITITFMFLFTPTVEDVRQKTYKYFPIKKPITLEIKTDNRTVTTVGYVESNEPEIFSEKETAKISIICPDPYLYSVKKSNTIFNGREPMFEFPFSNESLTRPLLEMGSIKNRTYENIYYDGDAEVGFHIIINAIGPVSTMTILNKRTNGSMIIDNEWIEILTGEGIKLGDLIDICTERGNKYVHLTRGDNVYNIINAIDKDSEWFVLSKGDNQFAYIAEDGISNIQFRIESKTAYEGI